MDILSTPRPDDDLCCSVLLGNISSINYAIEEIKTNYNPATFPAIFTRALTTCVSTKNIAALECLLEHSEVNEKVAEAAALSESAEIVDVVLNHNWPINQQLRGGSIPSMLSFAVRNSEFMDWLLVRGADPNATSLLGETALSFAIREGTMKVIRKLIAAGADISRGDLLHCASQREQSEDTIELIDMLVGGGVGVNTYAFASVLRYGFKLGTPLHTACEERNVKAAATLFNHGADPYCLMKQGESLVPPTPLELVSGVLHMQELLDSFIAARPSD